MSTVDDVLNEDDIYDKTDAEIRAMSARKLRWFAVRRGYGPNYAGSRSKAEMLAHVLANEARLRATLDAAGEALK